jgi:hypothetical protein
MRPERRRVVLEDSGAGEELVVWLPELEDLGELGAAKVFSREYSEAFLFCLLHSFSNHPNPNSFLRALIPQTLIPLILTAS